MTLEEFTTIIEKMGFFVKFFNGSNETYIYKDNVDREKIAVLYEEPGMFNTNYYHFGNIPSMEKREKLLGIIVEYSLMMPWLREADKV